MPTPMTQSRFPELVRKGWDKMTLEVTDELHQRETMKDVLYTEQSNDSAYFEKYQVSGLPDIPRFSGALRYLDAAPGYGVRIEPAEFAAAVELERKLWLNNLYPVMKDWNRSLLTSMHRTKEKAAIKGYALVDSTAFDFMPWNEEGVAIASTAHTTKNDGVSTTSGFGNLGTSAFDPTIVEATRILMRGFRGLNGELLDVRGNGLIGPTTLDQKFAELNTTPYGLDTPYRTTNTQAGKWNWKTSQYINDWSTKSWAMVDWEVLKKAAVWLTRLGDERKATIDFETYRLKFSIYGYWGYGFLNWQFIYFHKVT
jgi:hypothetical protein